MPVSKELECPADEDDGNRGGAVAADENASRPPTSGAAAARSGPVAVEERNANAMMREESLLADMSSAARVAMAVALPLPSISPAPWEASTASEERASDNKRKPNPTIGGGTPGPQRKKLKFVRCGECPACTLKENCGECVNCTKRGRRCKRRSCSRMVTEDGAMQRISVTAPSGTMGISLKFVGEQPFLLGIDDNRCQFKSEVEPGYLLLSIAGKPVCKPGDLICRIHHEREVIFARKLAIPKVMNLSKVVDPLVLYDSVKPVDVWATSEAAKLFAFKESDDVKQRLKERVELLRNVNRSEDGYKLVVPSDVEEAKPFTKLDLMTIRHRALFLAKACVIALDKMDLASFSGWREGGKFVTRQKCKTKLFTWEDCCAAAIEDLHAIGVETYKTVQALSNLNKKFRVDEMLILKRNTGRLDSASLFQHYPLLKEMVTTFVAKNKRRMSAPILHQEVATNILPSVLRQASENGGAGSKEYKLLVRVTETPPCKDVILHWISHLGLKYDKHSSRRGKEWAEQHREATSLYYSNPENRLKHKIVMQEYYKNNPRKPRKSNQTPVTSDHENEGADVA